MVYDNSTPKPEDEAQKQSSLPSEDTYQIKKLGFGLRVTNLKEDQVEGLWNMNSKEWFDIQAFINKGET